MTANHEQEELVREGRTMAEMEDRWHKWPDERPPEPEGGPGGGDGDQYLTYKSTRGLVVYSLLWWAGVRWW